MPPEGAPPYRVAKRNKRLIIVGSDDRPAYCMPDFLRPVTDRSALQVLADQMAGGYDIRAITDFEARHRRQRQRAAKAQVGALDVSGAD